MKQTNQRLLLVLILLLLVGISTAAQERATPYIYALSNPVIIPPGQTSGTVTLVWDGGKDHPYAEVWIRVDQNDETFIVEQGKGTRNEKVEFGRSYEFKLSDANVLLASVRVTVTHERETLKRHRNPGLRLVLYQHRLRTIQLATILLA